jgi:hypothetical protein
MNHLSVIVLCFGLLANVQLKQNKERFVRRVRIVATYYSVMTFVDVTPKQQLNGRFREIDATIYDPALYIVLDSLIRDVRINAAPKSGGAVSARVTCLVYREKGHPDTVSFGGPHMQINHRIGYLQPGVLLTLGEYLPRKLEQDIYYYLDTIWMRQPTWPKYGYESRSK